MLLSICVKQAVLAGNAPRNIPSGYHSYGYYDSTNYWFSYRYLNPGGYPNSGFGRSTSWVRVIDFHTYWNKRNTVVTSTSKVTIYNNANIRDIIQFKNSSGWYHSVIVTDKKNENLYITGHTDNYVDKSFNNNISTSVHPEYIVIKFS